MNYPPSQWERIMKIQDVFNKAHHKHLTWREAAEILHVDERTIRRWKQTVEENGYQGLLDRRTQRPSPKKAPESICNQVLKLYRDTYKDWNVKHFHEQLTKYGISYQYTSPRLSEEPTGGFSTTPGRRSPVPSSTGARWNRYPGVSF